MDISALLQDRTGTVKRTVGSVTVDAAGLIFAVKVLWVSSRTSQTSFGAIACTTIVPGVAAAEADSDRCDIMSDFQGAMPDKNSIREFVSFKFDVCRF